MRFADDEYAPGITGMERGMEQLRDGVLFDVSVKLKFRQRCREDEQKERDRDLHGKPCSKRSGKQRGDKTLEGPARHRGLHPQDAEKSSKDHVCLWHLHR